MARARVGRPGALAHGFGVVGWNGTTDGRISRLLVLVRGARAAKHTRTAKSVATCRRVCTPSRERDALLSSPNRGRTEARASGREGGRAIRWDAGTLEAWGHHRWRPVARAAGGRAPPSANR